MTKTREEMTELDFDDPMDWVYEVRRRISEKYGHDLERYPDFPRSHPISTFPKRITDKTGANADRFAGYCLRKTGKFV